ncbi:class I SAM-dependent methyltransferase [Cellulomonas xylanilytica]|nr:class I SAM-dependent methyltransferase [Cellulomonas xylanilytica]
MTIDLQTENDHGHAATELDLDRVVAFAGQIAQNHAIASNGVLTYLGDRLGLWRTLASVGPVTSAELAEHAGLAERYVREWVSAQAAAGYVTYDAATQRFTLPAEHAAVLADDDSPAALVGAFEITAAVWASVDRLAHAYTTGEGVGWHEHDDRLFSGVERFFRPLYAGSLVDAWIPAVDGLTARLTAGARVLDVGCGLGSATLLMAEAFPASTFLGVDNHGESVRRATAAAQRAGAADRVAFTEAAADEYDGGPYDVICMFDALHDMGDPLGALRHARAALSDDGILLVVEPAAADRLEDNLHPLGLSWYAASATMCVPGSLSQAGGAGLGAQAGAARLLELFALEGFGTARVAATTQFNLVIEARR